MKIIRKKDGAALHFDTQLKKSYTQLDSILKVLAAAYRDWEKIVTDPQSKELRSEILIDLGAVESEAKRIADFAGHAKKEFEKRTKK